MSYTFIINGNKLTPQQAAAHRDKAATTGKLNDMLARRQAPSGRTESTFLSGLGTLDKQFEGDTNYLNMLRDCAKRDGYDVKPNDVYMPTLASHPGDPRAFIASRGEAVKVAEERGHSLSVDGRELVRAREPELDPYETAPALAEDLVQEAVPMAIKNNPKLSPGEAREMIIDKHGCH